MSNSSNLAVTRRKPPRLLDALEFATEQPVRRNDGESSPGAGSESSQTACLQEAPAPRRRQRAISLSQARFATEPIQASKSTASFRMAGLDADLRPERTSSGYNDSEMERRSPGALASVADLRQGMNRRKSWSGLGRSQGLPEPGKEIANMPEDGASLSSPSSSNLVRRRNASALSAGYGDAELPPSPPKLPARYARSIGGLTRSLSLGSLGSSSPKACRPLSAGSLGGLGPLSPTKMPDPMRSTWEPLEHVGRLDAGGPTSPRPTTGGWVGRAITKRPSRSALI